MAEIFRVIETITNKELRWCIKSDEFDFVVQLVSNPFMQQSANFERAGLSLAQNRQQLVERPA